MAPYFSDILPGVYRLSMHSPTWNESLINNINDAIWGSTINATENRNHRKYLRKKINSTHCIRCFTCLHLSNNCPRELPRKEVPSARQGALPQASASYTGFFKDHTAVNILSALNKQVKVWLKSEGLSPFGIFWDNRTNVKSVQDGIFTKLHPVLHNLTMQQFLRIEHFKSASRRLPNLWLFHTLAKSLSNFEQNAK